MVNIFKTSQNRDRAEQYISMTAYDDEYKIVYSEADNSLGCLLVFHLTPSGNKRSLTAIEGFLKNNFPAGTIMQFINFGHPYIEENIAAYLRARDETPSANDTIQMAKEGTQKRAEMMIEGTRKKLVKSVETTVTKSIGYFTIKVPLKVKKPMESYREEVQTAYQRELREFVELVDTLISQAANFNIYMQKVDEKIFKGIFMRYFDPFGKWHQNVDDYVPLNEQVVPVGASFSYDKPRDEDIYFSGFNDNGESNYAGMLAIDTYPARENNFSFYRMIEMLGEPSGNGVQIGMPYALTTTIHVPDQNTKNAKVRTNQGITLRQDNALMRAVSERLGVKIKGFQILGEAILNKSLIVEVSTSLILFNRSRRELKKGLDRLASYYGQLGMTMRRERYIPGVHFFNNLPLNASPETIQKTYRFKTMASNHAAHLLPIYDEWQGFGGEGSHMMLNTRLGRILTYDIYSPYNLNYSWATVAGSGSGKSFFMNRLIQDHLSIGTKIYAIDNGGSLSGLGQTVNAQILDFDMDSNICLNPFTKIDKIDEEIEFILPIFTKMMCPNDDDKLSALQTSFLEQAIKGSFVNKRNKASIGDVISNLRNRNEHEAHVMAELLQPFDMNGSMGRWFNGDNNFRTEAQFTILEIKRLSANPRLMKVVLMALSVAITQEMYLSGNRNKKMLILEEAGDLLADVTFADFTARLVSKVRKEVGGVGVVCQNFGQLFQAENGRHGRTIMNSAGTIFVMQQNQGAINDAIAKGYLTVDSYQEHLIRSCHTSKGNYSEIVILRGDQASGIARLIESPFNKVLFSTEGDSFIRIKEAIRKYGHGEAVVKIVNEEVDKMQMRERVN